MSDRSGNKYFFEIQNHFDSTETSLLHKDIFENYLYSIDIFNYSRSLRLSF